MSPEKRKEQEYNRNWEAEIAAFDAEREAEDREYHRKHVVLDDSGKTKLTVEETEVFEMALRGIPLAEIAEQCGVEEDVIFGLVEIIRAKLAISD